MAKENLDKKGVIRAMFLAILIAFLGIGVLGWQYRRLERERLPALEEKIAQGEAASVLDKFMELRIKKNETQAMYYLTERTAEQKNQGEFSLIANFEDYEILKTEKLNEEQYRFLVKIYQTGEMGDFIEIINLIKILDRYYIDSVVIAG